MEGGPTQALVLTPPPDRHWSDPEAELHVWPQELGKAELELKIPEHKKEHCPATPGHQQRGKCIMGDALMVFLQRAMRGLWPWEQSQHRLGLPCPSAWAAQA